MKVADVLARLPRGPGDPLPAPPYAGPREGGRARVVLGVESMARHVTDEGAQLQWGLQAGGYALHGLDFGPSLTDVPEVLRREDAGVVVVQDQREWDGITADRSRDPRMRFASVEALAARPDVFRVGVVKDAQHDPDYHRRSLGSFGAHAVIHYYHPAVVAHLAPYVRPQHLVRIWHTVDASLVPPYKAEGRDGCLLSGALSRAYPLRQAWAECLHLLPSTTMLAHPGYHRRGSATPAYLQHLSRFKVALCDSSVYGYSLRKLIEGVACGCVVITDLPTDDVLPEIDSALVRVEPTVGIRTVADLIRHHLERYDPERQRHYAALACKTFDFRVEGVRLAWAIEEMRLKVIAEEIDRSNNRGTHESH